MQYWKIFKANGKAKLRLNDVRVDDLFETDLSSSSSSSAISVSKATSLSTNDTDNGSDIVSHRKHDYFSSEINNLNNYVYDNGAYHEKQESRVDMYKKFLQVITPKSSVFFAQMKKNIKCQFSVVKVISFLEPYMIYAHAITLSLYRSIHHFIQDESLEYKKQLADYSAAFKTLERSQQSTKGDHVALLRSLLGTDYESFADKLNDSYDSNARSSQSISDSEFMKKVILSDSGQLLNKCVAFSNIALMFPDELNSILEKDQEKIYDMLDETKGNDTCKSILIAKKYMSKKELLADNKKFIFFDKEYDTTPYALLEDPR